MATTPAIPRLLGGKRTLEHTGKRFDAYQGYARDGLPEEFCKTFGLQRSMRFSTKLCPQEAARVMAKAWCSRMQHFYNMRKVTCASEEIFGRCRQRLGGRRNARGSQA